MIVIVNSNININLNVNLKCDCQPEYEFNSKYRLILHNIHKNPQKKTNFIDINK